MGRPWWTWPSAGTDRSWPASPRAIWWVFSPSRHVWTPPEGEELYSVALDSTGRLAALGTHLDHGFIIELAEGRIVQRVPGHRLEMAFPVHGQWIAAGSPEEFSIHSLEGKGVLRRWERRRAVARESPLALSEDDRVLAVPLTSGSIHLLDVVGGGELVRLESPVPLAIGKLAFAPDGRRLAATSPNGCVQLWELGRLREGLRPWGLDWPNRCLRTSIQLLQQTAAKHQNRSYQNEDTGLNTIGRRRSAGDASDDSGRGGCRIRPGVAPGDRIALTAFGRSPREK